MYKMPDYQKGKFYKIVCSETSLTYYGSTTKPRISDRISNHRADYKKYLSDPKTTSYITSFTILEKNNYEYSLVELFLCNSKDELHAS